MKKLARNAVRALVFIALSFHFLAIPSLVFGSHAQHPDFIDPVTCPIEVRYSPHGGAIEAVLSMLDRAQQWIIVAMYGLTHSDIIDAIIAARSRGVEVGIKLDRLQSAGQSQSAAITKLEAADVLIEVSNQSRQLHDKFAVIDAEILQSRPVSECCVPFCGRERTPVNSVEANGPRGGQYSGPLSLNFCNLDKG